MAPYPRQSSEFRLDHRRRWRLKLLGRALVEVEQATPVGALGHRVLDARRHEGLAHADLPAATQGPVDRNQLFRDVAARHRELVLLLEKRLFGGEDGRVVGLAIAVLYRGEIQRLTRRGNRLGELVDGLLGAQKRDQRVLDLLLRLQHLLLVGQSGFLEHGVLGANLVGDLAVVQNAPLDSRADIDRAAVPLREVAHLQATALARDKAERAAQRDRRIELGLGGADLGALHGRGLRRGPDVRTSPQQIHRYADRYGERRLGDWPVWAEQI